MATCTSCGNDVTGKKFCQNCGTPVQPTGVPAASGPTAPPPISFCTSCGRQGAPGERFCSNCGSPLGAAASTGAPVTDTVWSTGLFAATTITVWTTCIWPATAPIRATAVYSASISTATAIPAAVPATGLSAPANDGSAANGIALPGMYGHVTHGHSRLPQLSYQPGRCRSHAGCYTTTGPTRRYAGRTGWYDARQCR